jgi:hypothetical protein
MAWSAHGDHRRERDATQNSMNFCVSTPRFRDARRQLAAFICCPFFLSFAALKHSSSNGQKDEAPKTPISTREGIVNCNG